MLSLKNKLDNDLKISLNNKEFKYYRILIHYKIYAKKLENKILNYGGNIIHHIPSIKIISAIATNRAIERLLEYPEVDHICLDKTALICAHKDIMKANKVNYKTSYKLTGNGVCIALIDTGVYPHPNLIRPTNKIIKFVDLINNVRYPYDDNGHGTVISGILCADKNNSSEIRGIAPDSNIYCIKAFNELGKGYISDILFSIQIVSEEISKFNIRILCLPFEILENDHFILSLFSEMFELLNSQNIVIIVPSGHNGNFQNSIKGISILNNCITVGGLDTTGRTIKPYKFSSSGPYKNYEKPDLSAACVDIYSLNCNTNYISERNGMKLYPQHLDNLYTCYTGTSCAAAYISGLCALLLENNPSLTPNDILSLLKTSCNLLNIPKYIQGSGMVDFNKLIP